MLGLETHTPIQSSLGTVGYTYLCDCKCVYLRMCTHGGQRLILGSSSIVLHLIFLRKGPLIHVVLTHVTVLSGQCAPGICLSAPPQRWDFRCTAFYMGAEDSNSGPHAIAAAFLILSHLHSLWLSILTRGQEIRKKKSYHIRKGGRLEE